MFVIVYFLTTYHVQYVGMFVICLSIIFHMSCPSSSSRMIIKPKAKKEYIYTATVLLVYCV